ncbi:Outer dynein arm protein 1 (Docking complex component 2) [Durusdinium trenchii]|uniref:Outer dynein arm protein 1 (Docking complex component 2) n=1 Tax=Durusdinium trenchii TaxID=1381693 RepID=A0ABP0M2G5_9DINO
MQRQESTDGEATVRIATQRALPAHQAYLQDHLQRMHNEIESTTRKLELEKRRLNKLDEDAARMRSECTEKTLKVQKDGQGVPLKKLENRLAKAIAQLNLLGHENAECRNRIDVVRRERLQLIQVFKKLQQDIKDNMSTVSQIHRESDAARREQEERMHKMAALKKQVEEERKAFKRRVQELKVQYKEREQYELKERVKMVKESDKKEELDGKGSKTRSLKADEEEHFNSTLVMRRILKLAFLNAIQRRHIRQHQKNIEVFEQAFATIKSTTGISDIEEIVKIFVALEQRNFSLLTYVNALNREIEALDKQNRQLKEQLANQQDIEAESEKKRIAALTDLKSQIESTAAATEDNKLQASQQSEIIDRCRPVIHYILKTVERENRGFGGHPAPEFGSTGENLFGWLTYIEKTLTQWKDFLPDPRDKGHFKTPNKNYKYTVGNQVLALQPKKPNTQPVSLVKPSELPSAANFFLEQGPNQRAAMAGREEDSSDDEEELMAHPWPRQDLRDKANASVAKRRRHRRTEGTTAQGQQSGPGAEQARPEDAAPASATRSDEAPGELNYEEIVEGKKDADEESAGSDDSDMDDDIGPTDEEINEIFLKRYKMSKEELQGMADKMGIQLNNLCYLKQEFDAYDEDRSGYIDVKELKGLLEKLGEELSEEELDQAFRELDSDGSGEIEFFEFVEWFTSED